MTRHHKDGGPGDDMEGQVLPFPSDQADEEPEESIDTGWSTPVDLKAALKGEPPPAPAVAQWTVTGEDKEPITRALFYPNEVHSVFGEPEAMKSWLLLHAAAQEVASGSHVVYIDMESNDRYIVSRMLALGVKPKAIKKCFHYFRPHLPLDPYDDRKGIRANVSVWKPTLVVLDGVTEGFALNGLSINSPEETAVWFRNVARQFQIREPIEGYEGPAIVELDHVVKARESRGTWAIGSQHKKAGIKGAAYQVESVRPFGMGRHGISRVILEKDSPGGVDWEPFGKDRRRLVAEFHCDSDGQGAIDAYLSSPLLTESDGSGEVALVATPAFQALMAEVLAFIKASPGCTQRNVIAGLPGKRDYKINAIEQLVLDGRVVNKGTAAKGSLVVTDES